MKCLNYVLLASLVVFCTNCEKSTKPIGNDKPPPGYQEDIPWPSLADSPWPMNHHDPQNTGRSKEVGPNLGIVDWSLESYDLETGISIGPDSTIYFVYGKLFAVTHDGAEEWSLEINNILYPYLTPIITADGTIYTTAANKLVAISSEKIVKWEYVTNSIINWMVNIGNDGILYILDGNKTLNAISPSGALIWQYSDDRFTSFTISGISFSPDGNTLFIPGSVNSVLAFNIHTQTIDWVFGDRKMYNSPLIDSDGNIYILPKYDEQGSEKAQFYSLNKHGEIRWVFEFNYEYSPFHSNTPTIDRAGNIYFATDTLYSLDYSGNLNWKAGLDGFCDCPLVCDVNSNIYVGTMGSELGISISSYDVNGNLNWKISDSQYQVGGSPALGFNSLYFPTWRSTRIYSIK
ncbi:MAG: hypothetical protein ACXAC2_07760 [Candidatus Kariarchaeaceae archaeon]|jgi:hypothetical protein